ncbi:MAG TPA: LLM class flavin-dependent oxidoreductase [Iamia sp.]|jgi:alkanesulfonate monooxygenase SsuD/methylene tetrahydromethanopterin reductase-like flavin-dependent oxidoreductase (luciferase family)|nr:LLM class flavin-dependent oxidoreductase [Iamia sp.]
MEEHGPHIHLGVALDGAGWHPAAWREPTARPGEVFDASYWIDLARTAERGVLDYVTIEDAFTLQSAHPFRPDDRTDQVRGRLDAALIAARMAPATAHLGLVPTITTTHTEPFHVGVRVASLDWVSRGRAGWRAQVQRQHDEVAQFGRRHLSDPAAAPPGPERDAVVQVLFDEAADGIEVARRLWDSWEDDAEIRDRPTGRFVDRDRLHPIDFEGRHFSVRGPSITPRSPQGQPPVVVLAHARPAFELAAGGADIVLVTPHGEDDVRSVVRQVRAAEAAVGRTGPPLLVHADLLVLLEPDADLAVAARAGLDDLDGQPLRSDAAVVTADPAGLVEVLLRWRSAGLDGFRLRPARLPADLDAIVDEVVPRLEERGVRPTAYEGQTLRGRLGLERPANRHAGAGA